MKEYHKADFVERSYKLPSGAVISVPESYHETANALANRFYVVMGNISRPGFDYSKSPHPIEQMMYTMALEALDYESEYGF
ncbi:MAG: hypothetical protein ACKO0Z_14255 [Betaproteobacteria bacterium]